MTTYPQLEKELTEDCQIEPLNLGEESLRCSRLHSKWIRYFNEFKAKYYEQSKKVDRMEGLRRRYFKGELSKTELGENGWEPWNLAEAKTQAERERQLETDPIMIPLRDRMFQFKLCTDTCELALKEIHQRSHNLKTALEWAKFQAGNG